MTRYLTPAETAKFVRKALKESFPDVRFSVRAKSYSMGGSIDVYWTDGPLASAVDRIVRRFAGARFDGMTDYKGGAVHQVDGEEVHFGADFIFTHRTLTEGFIERVREAFHQLDSKDKCELLNRCVGCWPQDDDAHRIAAHVLDAMPPKPSPTAESAQVVRTY